MTMPTERISKIGVYALIYDEGSMRISAPSSSAVNM